MTHRFLPLVGLVLLAAACSEPATSPGPDSAPEAADAAFNRAAGGTPAAMRASPRLQEVNERLAEAGANFAVARAELAVRPGAGPDQALIVFADDRTLRLTSRWVPGDPRRRADGANLTYLVYEALSAANGSVDSEPAIDASFGTWGGLACGNVDLVKRTDTGANPSWFFGGDPYLADIVTLGFLPGFIFDVFLGTGAAENVLGVTYTFIFGSFDSGGNFTPSDVDGNGLEDTAFKEIWYNDDFAWNVDGVTSLSTTDIETVAFHENGHAMELGHFGKIAINLNAGLLQVSPRAAMNAIILGTLRHPLGTDNASYCGTWASWPNR